MFVFIFYFQNLLLFNFFPILIYTKKRFISLDVTELFFLFVVFLFYLLSVCLIGLIKNYIIFFLYPSWNKQQNYIFAQLFSLFRTFFSLLYFLTHVYILPKIFYFFTFFEMKQTYFLLKIELESRIQNYTYWIFKTNFAFATSSLILVFIFINMLLFFKLIFIYINVYRIKKYIVFALYIFFTFFFNLDPYFLIVLFLFLFAIIELCIYLLGFLIVLQI